MKMAIKDGQVMLVDISPNRYMAIKSTGLMKWDRQRQMLHGPATAELLNQLAKIFPLPEQAEQMRGHLNRVNEAIDRERKNPHPVPLYDYPVKIPMYSHQVRGANMSMILFGLVDPPGGEEYEET